MSASCLAPWINSICCLRSSDLVLSGSNDGVVRLWHADVEARTLRSVGNVPDIPGFVNGLAIAKSGRFFVAAVGQEHRLGRWSRIKEARNGAQLVQLPVAE